MKLKIDVKSLVVGVVLGLIVSLTIAAVNMNPQKSYESGPGRFKLIIGDKRVYILDSTNGRPWTVPSDSRSGTMDKDKFFRSKLDIYDAELAEPVDKRRK